MSHLLHKKGDRDALPARRDPYWGAPIREGRHVGFRKLANGAGTWIARMWHEDSGKYVFHALGQATSTLGYDEAKNAAEAWFALRDAGVSDEPPTVSDACREYVIDRRAEKGEATAYDAEVRFKRSVFDDPLGAVRLDRLTTTKLKDWRNRVSGGKSGQDREFRSLKAALNLAVENSRVSADVAKQWRRVKPHKGADGRRDLFLDREQRRALLDACQGAVRELVEAAAHTGARPGELVALTRADFDARTETLRVRDGKTGYRAVPLAPAAAQFFKRMAKDKLPTAPLLSDDKGQSWMHHALWAKEIRAAAERAKLPAGVVLYTFRHSWITEALRAGVPTLDVARMTGTSLQMIEDHYAQFVQSAARDRLAAVAML